jgi:hypothetical protein
MAEQAGDMRPSLSSRVKKWFAFLPDNTPPRILLIYFSVLLQLIALAVSGIGYATGGAIYWLAGMILWIFWFFIMFLIVIPRTDTFLQRHRGWLKPIARTILILLLIMGIAEGGLLGVFAPGYITSGASNDLVRALEELSQGFQYNDGAALIQQGAENLLDGQNPYSHGNIVLAFTKYGGSYERTTPLRVGRFADLFPYPARENFKQVWDEAIKNPSPPPPELESNVCYPAGSFLLVAPFVAAGIKDIRYIYLIFVVAGLIYATWRIPAQRRPLFIGVALISLEIWNGLAIGETSTMIFPCLLLAWITLGKNNWLSAIFMGLAVASKQTTWFFLPFYLILLWRTSPPRTLVAALGIIAAIFFSFNIYFIISDPSMWLQSIASPMAEPLFPLGVGIISLVTGGLVNIQTSLLFTTMELVVLVAGIIWYIRNCLKYPEAGVVLSVLPLFFAWRSLWTYFFYVAIIILAMMLVKEPGKSLGTEQKPINAQIP